MIRVLVADDDENVRIALQRTLEIAGLEVVAARDGREALSLLREQAFDLVVCDIFMPRMDGLEAIPKLRREFPAMKIIAISGGGQSGDMDLLNVAKLLGANAVLHKPLSPKQLMPSLRCVLEATT